MTLQLPQKRPSHSRFITTKLRNVSGDGQSRTRSSLLPIRPGDLLLHEDEIRSAEGPDARRGGPEGTAPVLQPRLIVWNLQLVLVPVSAGHLDVRALKRMDLSTIRL